MIKKGDKVYLVKYALTAGIEVHTAIEDQRVNSDFISVLGRVFTNYKLGRDVLTDPKAALAAAESMRAKKIKSLDKQISALNKMQFSV